MARRTDKVGAGLAVTRADRLAEIEREESFWRHHLHECEEGIPLCRAKLADLAEQRARLLAGQPDEDRRRRRWPVPCQPDDS